MIDSTEKSLLKLLEEDPASVVLRENSTYSRLIAPYGNNIVLFGAGGLGLRTLQGLRRLGIEPLAFADNNQSRWNTTIAGIDVLSPMDAVKKYGQKAIFIVTIWSDTLGHPLDQVSEQLNNYGQANVVSFGYLYWKYPDVFLPYFGLDLPHKTLEQADKIQRCFSLWADEASRQEYLAQIRWRLWLDFKGLPKPVNCTQYFPSDIIQLSQNEVFVDCGAFDGDTIRKILSHTKSSFDRIIAFEPDPDNFTKLQRYISSLDSSIKIKITAIQYAVGSRVGKVRFEADSTMQSCCGEKGNIEVDCVTLDHVLTSVPTYIKMDIEGAEPDLLAGGRNTIINNQPILAISIYHRFDHLWSIPLYLQTLSNRYRYYLRPHCHSCWDLVCYAVPSHRTITV